MRDSRHFAEGPASGASEWGFPWCVYCPVMPAVKDEEIPESAPAWSRDRLKADPHGDQEKADRVKRMFGAIAPRYDCNNRLHSFWQDQRWRRQGARLTGLKAGEDVVDVACGTGDLSEVFNDMGAGTVIGVDFTPEMLDVARQRALDSGRTGLEYRQGDAMALDLPDATADVVSIAFGIRNVAAPELALREFRRILRPGGRLLVLEFSEPTNPVIRFANRIYTRNVMPFTASILAGDRSGAYRYLPRSVETFLSRSALEQSITEAGFSSVEQVSMCFGVCVAYIARA